MPYLLVGDDSDDPVKAVESLLDAGAWQPIDGGWLVTPRDEPDDPQHAKTLARQRRYRARKRDAARREPATRRDAETSPSSPENSKIRGVIHSLPALEGQEGGSETPSRDAARRDATRRGERDATRRDAEPRRVEYGGPESWRVEPLTEDDRELGRRESARIASELRHPSNGDDR